MAVFERLRYIFASLSRTVCYMRCSTGMSPYLLGKYIYKPHHSFMSIRSILSSLPRRSQLRPRVYNLALYTPSSSCFFSRRTRASTHSPTLAVISAEASTINQCPLPASSTISIEGTNLRMRWRYRSNRTKWEGGGQREVRLYVKMGT